MSLTVTFKLGTDLDKAQVLVQNRVADRRAAPARGGAAARRHDAQELARPDDGRAHALARRLAATSSTSPTTRRCRCKDVLPRLDGVGDVTHLRRARLFACASGSIPDKLAARGLTAGDVVAALRGAERAGRRRRRSASRRCRAHGAFQLNVEDAGPARRSARSSATSSSSRRRRARDRASRDVAPRRARRRRTTAPTPISTASRAVALGIFQRPGSNALATADAIQATMAELSKRLPAGPRLRHRLQPDRVHRGSRSTRSIKTIFEAVILVVHRGHRSSCRPGAPRSSRSSRSRCR